MALISLLLQIQLLRPQPSPVPWTQNQLRGRSDGNKIYPVPDGRWNGKWSRGLSLCQGLVRSSVMTLSNLRTKEKEPKLVFQSKLLSKRERGKYKYPEKGIRKRREIRDKPGNSVSELPIVPPDPSLRNITETQTLSRRLGGGEGQKLPFWAGQLQRNGSRALLWLQQWGAGGRVRASEARPDTLPPRLPISLMTGQIDRNWNYLTLISPTCVCDWLSLLTPRLSLLFWL